VFDAIVGLLEVDEENVKIHVEFSALRSGFLIKV
jgi:hypothetical protein